MLMTISIVVKTVAAPYRRDGGIFASWSNLIMCTTPIGLTTFLITKTGKPYAPNDLSEQFREWCDEAGIPPQYSLHGLRHAMGDNLAENDATPNEVAAVLGHASVRSALHYTQGADRKKLARKAMARVIKSTNQGHPANPDVSEDDLIQTHRSEKA
jgi:integrase